MRLAHGIECKTLQQDSHLDLRLRALHARPDRALLDPSCSRPTNQMAQLARCSCRGNTNSCSKLELVRRRHCPCSAGSPAKRNQELKLGLALVRRHQESQEQMLSKMWLLRVPTSQAKQKEYLFDSSSWSSFLIVQFKSCRRTTFN